MAVQHRQIFWSILFTLLLFCVQALPAFRFFDSPASYVPMHIVLELLSIAVSIMVFSLAWNLRGLKENSQPILLGAGFLAVSLIDLAHTLSFAGMPDLVTPSDPEKAINFWLAGRYVAALILLAVALLPRRHWGQLACHGFLAAALSLAGGVWWLGLFHPEWLPRFFIPGQGLTATKVGAEYFVAGLYGMTAILLFRTGYRTQNRDRLWLAAAAWIQGLAELFFTLYADVTDLFNLAGHVYKAIAYLAVYRALFVAGVQAPYRELEAVADELRLAATTFESQEGIMITDAKEVILRVNRAFTEITGYTLEDLRGKTPRILTSGRQDREFYVAMWQSIAQSGSWRGEVWNRRKNGVIYPEWLTITAVKGHDGTVTHYVANIIDITERKAAADQIEYLDFYDPLTQLPNRKLMFDRLGQVLRNCERRQRQGALILIDLDDFRTLNDTQGHVVGDRLLIEVALRLNQGIRQGDTVARLGGDEFVVILDDLEPGEAGALHVENVAMKLQSQLEQVYWLSLSGEGPQQISYRCTLSIGIALFRDSSVSGEELLKRADTAMYQAKAAGRNTLRFFDPAMQSAVSKRAAMEVDLRQAIAEKQFLLHYQPQVDAFGQVVGAEALVRWQHPVRGLVSPAEFIPLAEETGLIVPLGQWVLATACEQLASWEKQPEMAKLTLAVNVSARQFALPNLFEEVRYLVESTGASPGKLKLELTESVLLENAEAIIDKMFDLKALGVSFSLDDFGTGYSSLSYLKRLPLDQLKIDQSFVRDVLTDQNDAAIARTVVSLGQSLGLAVIAEGVETEAQRQFLADHGCNSYQGYLFSRPLPLPAFNEFVRRQSRLSS